MMMMMKLIWMTEGHKTDQSDLSNGDPTSTKQASRAISSRFPRGKVKPKPAEEETSVQDPKEGTSKIMQPGTSGTFTQNSYMQHPSVYKHRTK